MLCCDEPYLRSGTGSVTVTTSDVVFTDFALYTGWSSAALIARVKSPFFDVGLLMAILLYIVALFGVIGVRMCDGSSWVGFWL